jgi:hypothetical protein
MRGDMKKILFFFIVLILGIISCKKTYTTFDFRQVAWGMSPAEVLDAEKKEYPNLKFDEKNKIIVIDNIGEPFTKEDKVYYEFTSNNKLSSVLVSFETKSLTKEEATKQAIKFIHLLSEKYGNKKEYYLENKLLIKWETERTIITQFHLPDEHMIRYESKMFKNQSDLDLKGREEKNKTKSFENY